MPELPEVETIMRALRDGGRGGPSILGWQVQHAAFTWPRTLAFPREDQFRQQITGQRVQSLDRRAKYLLIHLEQNVLVFHLRMSGDIRVHADPARENPLEMHDRMAVWFDSGYRLVFNDTRKFGRVWLLDDPSVLLAPLGPEPLDERLDAEEFYEMLLQRNRQLKPLLLDQHFLAGLGNIYTDEALHKAGLHPLTTAAELSYPEAVDLLSAIRSVLQEGIRLNGASIDWVYRGGSFQNKFRVYRRAGEPCLVCGTAVERIIVGQRGTHFCPMCQPFKGMQSPEISGTEKEEG